MAGGDLVWLADVSGAFGLGPLEVVALVLALVMFVVLVGIPFVLGYFAWDWFKNHRRKALD